MESKSRRLLQKASRLYLGAILLPLKAQLSTVTTSLLPALKLCSSLARERERRDLYRTAITDERGRFTLLPTLPGEYKLFAWEDFEGFAYMDPDFLRKYEELGTPVNVAPSGASDVEVKLIPASRR